MLNKLRDILKVKYPQDLSEKIIELYSKILSEYRKKNWQNCISNVGQFNEAIGRGAEASPPLDFGGGPAVLEAV